MKNNIKEAISNIEEVMKTIPESANKTFLASALSELYFAKTETSFYEVLKVEGLGMMEAPFIEYSTGLFYFDKEDAKIEADKLWKLQTTEEERKSGWCILHYEVKERNIN